MLTPAQLTTLKAAILADPAVNTKVSGTGTDYEFIANYLSAPASPAFTVWVSNLTPDLARSGVLGGIAQLDNLTVGKRDALLYLFAATNDCRNAAVRQAIDDLCGTQNTLKASLLVAEKRLANRAEKILATGTGSDAVPAITTFEGSINALDIGGILAA